MKETRLYMVALVAAVALVGCTDVSTDNGGGGAGGTAGSGGTSGMGGTGGATDSPPEATIIAPASDSGNSNPDYQYDGFDDVLQLWYTDVMLEGSGVDAEDGALTGASLVWKTNQTEIQSEVLGTGENLTVRLYSDDCFGVEHVITLEATDSSAQTTESAPRSLVIWTLC